MTTTAPHTLTRGFGQTTLIDSPNSPTYNPTHFNLAACRQGFSMYSTEKISDSSCNKNSRSKKRWLYSALALCFWVYSQATLAADKPNILWLISEDNSPNLGAYGDTYATTPNLDNLAKESLQFNNAFANAPVCAAARYTLYTGTYGATMGTQNMRSHYPIPDQFKSYAYYLDKAGYYLASGSLNNSGKISTKGKDDLNHRPGTTFWGKQNYLERPNKKQPFFQVANIGVTHESTVHSYSLPTHHNPDKVTLPPYHPDTKDIRQDWARYYDSLMIMDDAVGKALEDLKKSGEYDNTIVFYFSDHGGIIARSKRFLYDTGTKVPLLIHFPKKWQHLAPYAMGAQVDSVVSFVDMAPTLLYLAGLPTAKHFHGKNFLSKQALSQDNYAYLYRGRMDERIDLSRAIRDQQYKYIRNYMPHRPYSQYLAFLWAAKSAQSWDATCKAGKCNDIQRRFFASKPAEELYDTKADPWEINNLAADGNYKDVLSRMRKRLTETTFQYKDAGFVPEGELIERTKNSTPYDLITSATFPFSRVVETAEMASLGKTDYREELIKRLSDDEAVVRYWAALGCNILYKSANDKMIAALNTALQDSSGDVQIAAAEALIRISDSQKALAVLGRQVHNDNYFIGVHATNAVDQLGLKALPIRPQLIQAHSAITNDIKKHGKDGRKKYLQRALARNIEVLNISDSNN